jgi:hypothetical protein
MFRQRILVLNKGNLNIYRNFYDYISIAVYHPQVKTELQVVILIHSGNIMVVFVYDKDCILMHEFPFQINSSYDMLQHVW